LSVIGNFEEAGQGIGALTICSGSLTSSVLCLQRVASWQVSNLAVHGLSISLRHGDYLACIWNFAESRVLGYFVITVLRGSQLGCGVVCGWQRSPHLGGRSHFGWLENCLECKQ